LAALAEIIGQGRNSIFFKNFQKDQKALFAQAYNSTSELAGEFTVTVRPFPGKGLAEMEQLVRESLKEFESTGVDDDALERFIASYESRTLNSLQSIGSFGGKVSKLAAYETFAGNPNYIKKDLERYMSITKDDIRRVYNTYIKDKPAVILSVIPKGGDALKAAADNYTIDESQYKPGKDEYAGLTYKKPKDKFDRSKKPGAGPNPVVKVPDYWREDLKNGIQVIGTKYDELPLVQVLITIRGGHMMSATDPGKAGVASIMGSLMNEGTQKYSAEEFNNELRKLGSSISVNAGSESISVSMQSTLKNLDKTIALLEERMMHPKFEEADLARVKKQQLEGIKNAMTQPASIASMIFSDLLWGKESFRAISTAGTEETVNAISLSDVEEFYKKYFTPSVAEMVVVGNMEKADILGRMAFLQSWKGATVEVPQYGKGNVPDKTRIYLVNVDKAAQSEIRIGYPTGMTYDATGESYRVGLMNFALGGAFNSRINLNLREDKGWTYGARSSFIAGKNPGFFQASAGVKAVATDSAVYEFMKELKEYAAEGITAKELAFMKSSLGQSDARNYETLFQKAGFLNTILSYNLERDYKKKQEAILKGMKEEDVDKLAKKMLKTDNMYIVVVGDAALVRPGLERLGYEIIELDKEGNVIK
jgi:zinc protease